MAVHVEDEQLAGPGIAGRPEVLTDGREWPPVVWWAVLGGIFLAIEAYVLISWFASGDLHPTSTGVNPVPGWMHVSIVINEVQSVACGLLMIFFFLIRPWRRDGRVSTDGLFVITFVLIYWQDAIINYSSNWATYNAGFVNLGSWAAEIPGYSAPNGHLFPEPLLWSGPAYLWGVLGAVMLSNRLMRRAQRRWPDMRKSTVVIGFIVGFWVVDFLAEAVWMHTGMYTYPGSIPSLTLFHGHWFQFPIYESIFFGTCWGAWACLRYFRDDKGQTVAERGVERLKIPQRRKTLVRLLAISGIVNLIYLFGVNVPYVYFGLNASAWPKTFQTRSYFRDQLCGQGTNYACTSPKLPNPRPGSAYVTPEGKLAPPAER